jgi:uncharacterized protein
MELAVHHDEKAKKYYAVVDGLESVCEYSEAAEGTLTFWHTFVPEALRGRGIADELVRQALDDVLAKGTKVIPSCWFVRAYIQRHAKYQPLVA